MENKDFTTVDLQLIILRSECETNVLEICAKHADFYLNKYTVFYGQFCCDPMRRHKKKNQYRLQIISVQFVQKILENLNKFLYSGKKICETGVTQLNQAVSKVQNHQHAELFQYISQNEEKNLKKDFILSIIRSDHLPLIQATKNSESQSNPSTYSLQESSSSEGLVFSSESFTSSQAERDKINICLQTLKQSPLKVSGLHAGGKMQYIKRKLENVQNEFETTLKKVCNVDPDIRMSTSLDTEEELRKFRQLMSELKDKFMISDYKQKVQILTMFVNRFLNAYLIEFFTTSRRTVETAIKLKIDGGILSLPAKKDHKLSINIKNRILEYFSNPDFGQVRMMPGMNDSVSVGNKQHLQKRFILSNLKEMHRSYKKDFPEDKVSLSLFCALRPKYSIIAGPPNTQNVCGCEKHQNIKLLLYACKSQLSCNELISLLTCKSGNIDCMMRLCSVCSNKEQFKKTLIDEVFVNIDLKDCETEISYRQWTKEGDRAQLVPQTGTAEEILEKSIFLINELIPHHFVSKEQSRYLKELKNNLDNDNVIVMMDFSQNYSFVTQDEVQGFLEPKFMHVTSCCNIR